MKLSLPISSFLLLAAVLICASGDYLASLKATLLKLCAANTEGEFGTCCSTNNNGQDVTSTSALPSCFGSTDTTESGAITKLFAQKRDSLPLNEFQKIISVLSKTRG